MASRRIAREQALQALYAIDVGHRDPADAMTEIVGDEAPSDHSAFVRDLVMGTLEQQSAIDESIVANLQGWSLERLPALDRLILRMGAFELRFRPETPPAVVINEAVELAKKFSTEDSGRYVNGVLSAIGPTHAQA
jgi:N utilization substance protein B